MNVAQREHKCHTCILFLGSEHDSYTVPCAFRWPEYLRCHSKTMHLVISLSKIDVSHQNMNYGLKSGEVSLSVPTFEDKLNVIEPRCTSISANVVAVGRMVWLCSLVKILSSMVNRLSETV